MKTYQKAIDATHPMEDSSGALELAANGLAMKLVGERHEKRDLVNLVRWLILRRPQGLLPFPVVQSRADNCVTRTRPELGALLAAASESADQA